MSELVDKINCLLRSLRYEGTTSDFINADGINLTMLPPEHWSDGEIHDAISDLAALLDQLHRSMGGHGLKVRCHIEVEECHE